MKLQLPQITLLGIDCVSVERLQAALDASEREIEFGAVKLLTSLPTEDSRAVSIPHLDSIDEYSKFCITDLHTYVDTEYVIMIQYDGFILRVDLWEPEFLQYDYIGGPMFTTSWTPIPEYPLPTPLIVGNGGFTLRSKKFLNLCAQFVADGTITRQNPEDVALSYWYRKNFESAGMKYPSVELAMKFCVNAKYQEEYIPGFGFHGFYTKNMDALLYSFPQYPMHFLLPRIRWARLMQLKKVLQDSVIEGRYLSFVREEEIHLELWVLCANKKIESIWKKRREYADSAGEVIEYSEKLYTVDFVVRTKTGKIPFHIHFQTPENTTVPATAIPFLQKNNIAEV